MWPLTAATPRKGPARPTFPRKQQPRPLSLEARSGRGPTNRSIPVPFTPHTPKDHAALAAAGLHPGPHADFDTQPREQPVRCGTCSDWTMHQAGYCDAHYVPPAAARRAP